MTKLLFVTYGAGHAQSVLPVVEKMKANYDVVVLALTTASKVFDGDGYDVISYESLAWLADDKYKEYGAELVSSSGASVSVGVVESIAYHGISYLELLEEHGGGAAGMYSRLGRQAFFPVKFMEKVLNYIEPDVVVATSSPRSERAVLQAASNLHVKSICIVDLFALQEKEWVAQPNYASRVCVLNASVRSLLVAEGRNESDIIVTGNPAFDKLQSNELIASARKYKDRELPQGKNVLFWASQPEPEVHPFTQESGGDPNLPLAIEQKLVEFVESRHDWVLVIRLHPSENRYVSYKSTKVFISPSDEKMTDVLFSCNCLVTIASTVALEAHLIGKPVITIDKSIFTDDAPFSKMGVSKGVKDLSILAQAIEELTSKVSNDDEGPGELNATRKVIEVIEGLIVQ
ncbi:MAG: UDP-N-acetylglucosamine 2-epimerase [Colwellia sp.]|jgi:UDP-N-acetylglucosamine 2-epimerase